MARKKVAWIWTMIVVLALVIPGNAQLNRGILEGTVTDPQGAAIPGVKVTVTAVDTNVVLPTVTNSAGYYRVVDLVPGKYTVHLEATGFSPLDVTDITVAPGQTIRADAKLEFRVNAANFRGFSGFGIGSDRSHEFFHHGKHEYPGKHPSCRGEICSNSCSWCQG